MNFICDIYSAMKISSNRISRKIDISCPKWFKIDHSTAWFIVRFMSHSRYHAESGALLVLLYHVEYCDNMFYYVMMCEFICLYRFIKKIRNEQDTRVPLCCCWISIHWQNMSHQKPLTKASRAILHQKTF